MFCHSCGRKITLEETKFCPYCGANVFFADPPGESVKENSSGGNLYNQLIQCKPVVEEIFQKQHQLVETDKQIAYLRNKGVPSASPFTLFIASLALGVGAGALISVILVSLSESLSSNRIAQNVAYSQKIGTFVLSAGIAFVVSLAILTSINNKTQKRLQEEDKTALSRKQRKKQDLLDSIRQCFMTDAGQKATALIPQDYFYPQAYERILFYLNNGHADTMKEALREYDQYLHRCKLEYEATRAANASERSAHAAEKTAAASAEMANTLATIEQYQENTNFWVTYLGFKDLFTS